MTFLEVLGGAGVVSAISGISIKDVVSRIKNNDTTRIETYFSFLEGKQVLVAPFDDEVNIAVIKSLELIKEETEKTRLDVGNDFVKHLLLELVHVLSKELMQLYKQDASSNDVNFYKSLQVIRVKFAKVLSMLCVSHKIDLTNKQTDLARLVLEHAYRPR